MKILVTVFAVVTIMLMPALTGSATCWGVPVLVETFDGPDWPELWTSGSVTLSQGRARINSFPNQPVGGRGSFQSKFALVGDFDVRTEFFLDPWPYNNGLHFGFMVSPADNSDYPFVDMERFYDYGRQSEVSRVPHPVLHAERSVSNTNGMWRLTRSGDLFSAYTWDGGLWILMGSNSMTSSRPLYIGAGAWSDRVSSVQASIMFDNITVETGTIVGLPEPASALLIGAGLVFARFSRKRK
jgi:hypothetical protein